MNDEIAGVLKGYLSVEEEGLRHSMRDILEVCKSERGANEAIIQLENTLDNYSSGLEFLDTIPLYYIFLAYAQYKWRELPDSVKSVSNAIQGFEQQNQIRNNVVALWMRALIHREGGHVDAARQDITKGIELIERELEDSKRTNHYKECRDCEIIHSRMISTRDGLESVFQRQSSKTAFTPPFSEPDISMQSPWPGEYESHLSFPVYRVRTGSNGDISYENINLGEVIIETVMINGKAHEIHSLREWPKIVLRPSVYRWLQVQGKGMENAHPVRILEGDCILVMEISGENYDLQNGDIVIVSKHTTTGSEGASLIKRFKQDGLYSESDTYYPVIPLREVTFCGLAIAVAKQVK